MLISLLKEVTEVLKNIIMILNIPILIILVYATVVRLVEAVNQLSTQPDVQTVWAKILQTVKNFASVESYNTKKVVK